MATETFKHGSYYSEIATSIVPPSKVASPVLVIGTAPLHTALEPAMPNVPYLCNSYSDFVRYFGMSNDFEKYTICEAAQACFSLFNVGPLVVINVVDLTKHTKTSTKSVSVENGRAIVDAPVVLSTLVAKNGESELKIGTDFKAAYDSTGRLIFSEINSNVTTLSLNYSELDISKVTESEIIGGADTATGKNLGLEAIEDVYPRLGVIPGVIIAPKYSSSSAVAAVMKAKTRAINGCFNTICAVDLNTKTIKKYNDCNAGKNNNNLVDSNMIVCWPKVSLGGVQYHLSTQVAALMSLVDYENDDVPYVSPSNHNLQCDSAVLEDGSEVYLTKATANYLNSVGISTVLNFGGGYRFWSNRTGAYPSETDVKDNFIPLRRMISWLGNTLITTFFSKIDNPMNKRLVESVTDSVNIFLNGLAARGVILGGQVYFDETLNPLTSLINGEMLFSVKVGFVVPAEVIEFQIEFDTSYFSELFS